MMAHRLDEMTYWMLRKTGSIHADRLNLLLWEADLRHYRREGATLSGAMYYMRTREGPEPCGYFESVSRLQSAGAVRMKRIAGGNTELSARLMPEPEPAPCTLKERATMLSVHKRRAALSTAALRKRVCDEMGALWDETPGNQALSIAAASIIPAEITEADLAWAKAATEPAESPGPVPE